MGVIFVPTPYEEGSEERLLLYSILHLSHPVQPFWAVGSLLSCPARQSRKPTASIFASFFASIFTCCDQFVKTLWIKWLTFAICNNLDSPLASPAEALLASSLSVVMDAVHSEDEDRIFGSLRPSMCTLGPCQS